MLDRRCEVLIAAPSLAEILRFRSGTVLPQVRGVEVVDFDAGAARIVGERMPMDVLKTIEAPGGRMGYLKFDTLILACAVRHRAECLITLDRGFHPLAAAARMRVRTPREFLSTAPEQLVLVPPTER